MVAHQLVHYRFQGEVMRVKLLSFENHELVECYEDYVDVEKDCHECTPIEILAVISHEVALEPVL